MGKKRDRSGRPKIPSATAEALAEMAAWLEEQKQGFVAMARSTREMMRGVKLPQLQVQLDYAVNGVSVIDNLVAQLRYEVRRHARGPADEPATPRRLAGGRQ